MWRNAVLLLLAMRSSALYDFLGALQKQELREGACPTETMNRYTAMLCGGSMPTCRDNTVAAGDDKAFANPKGWCKKSLENVAKAFPECSLKVQQSEGFTTLAAYCSPSYSAVQFEAPMDMDCPPGSTPSEHNKEGTRKCAAGDDGKPCCVCKPGFKNGNKNFLTYTDDPSERYILKDDNCNAVDCPTTDGKVALEDGSANPECGCAFGKVGRINPSNDAQGWVSTCKWADAGTLAKTQSWFSTYGGVAVNYAIWKAEMDAVVADGLLVKYLAMYDHILKQQCHIPAKTTIRTRRMSCWYPQLQTDSFTYAYVRHDITRGHDCSNIDSEEKDGEMDYSKGCKKDAAETMKALAHGDSPAWTVPKGAALGLGDGWSSVLGEAKSTYMTDDDIAKLSGNNLLETHKHMHKDFALAAKVLHMQRASKKGADAPADLDKYHSQWLCAVNVEISNDIPLDEADASGASPESEKLTRKLGSLNTEVEMCAGQTMENVLFTASKQSSLPQSDTVTGVRMTNFDFDGSTAGNTVARPCNYPTTKINYAELNNAELGTPNGDMGLVDNDKACRCLKGQFGSLSAPLWPTMGPTDTCSYQSCPAQKYKNVDLVEGKMGGSTFETGCQCKLGWFNRFEGGHGQKDIPAEWASSSALPDGNKLYYRSITYKANMRNTVAHPCFFPCPVNAGPTNPALIGYVQAGTADCSCDNDYECKFVEGKPNGCAGGKPAMNAAGTGFEGTCVLVPKMNNFNIEAVGTQYCMTAGQEDANGASSVVLQKCHGFDGNNLAELAPKQNWEFSLVRSGNYAGADSYKLSVVGGDGTKRCLKDTSSGNGADMTVSAANCVEDVDEDLKVFRVAANGDRAGTFLMRSRSSGKCLKHGKTIQFNTATTEGNSETRCFADEGALNLDAGAVSMVWALRPVSASDAGKLLNVPAKYVRVADYNTLYFPA